jgi:hypothetical protein
VKNLLCRHCFHLFRDDRIGIVCGSEACSHVMDDRGEAGARYMDPRPMGLWHRWRRRLDLEAACPHCRQEGNLVPACPGCRAQLDVSIGEVEDRVIGVIGASESGKTHFLATILHQFLERKIGGDVWQVEMKPADQRLYRDYLRTLFEQQQELPQTQAALQPELRLMLRNQRDGRQTLLVFRDLGGEIFVDPQRLREVSFLRYAQGVVLLVDPLAFAPPPSAVWKPNGRPDAVEILDNYRAALKGQERYPEHRDLPLLPAQKALAVAVTKADLVLDSEHPFRSDAETMRPLDPGYWNRRKDEDKMARQWIEENLGRALPNVAGEFHDAGYFFVSSYGYRHQPGSPLREAPRPSRVHEPIFALLDRLASLSPSTAEDDAGL